MHVTTTDVETVDVDIAVLGSGGAGLMAVLHAARTVPASRIALVSKGAMGRSGCTIMVQGYNAAMDPADSFDLHLSDLLRVGEYVNDQELAWTLVREAPEVVRQLETQIGCFFDRREDGSLDQKPFAGQSFPRHVHRGTETGLEVMSRLRDHILQVEPRLFEDVRAVELLRDDGGAVAGVVLLDVRSGTPVVLRCPVVIVATGGTTTSYPVASSAREKTGDGMAMCYRAGLEFRDLEFVQFLSVGLVAGGSRSTGILLEEALRYAGGLLYNSLGERFMERYDPERLERADKETVVRAMYAEIVAGRGTSDGGVLLDMSSLAPEEVEERFPSLVERTRRLGRDLARQPVEVAPAAHFQIGGVVIGPSGETAVHGLLVAGEDAGGVHGAAWTGGNGIAESTVFGARAGAYASDMLGTSRGAQPSSGQVADALSGIYAPLRRESGLDPFGVTRRLREAMWRGMGPVRDESGLLWAEERLVGLEEEAARIAVPGPARANFAWQEAMDVANQVTVARAMAASALARRESRGVHARRDHPTRDDSGWLRYVVVHDRAGTPTTTSRPVRLTRMEPQEVGDG